MLTAGLGLPVVAGVQTDQLGHSQRMSLNRVKGFRSKEIARWSRVRLSAGTAVELDGLACFNAPQDGGYEHTPLVMNGPGVVRRRPVLHWVDTLLGNLKNAIHGTYHAIRSKHLPRYLGRVQLSLRATIRSGWHAATLGMRRCPNPHAVPARKVG